MGRPKTAQRRPFGRRKGGEPTCESCGSSGCGSCRSACRLRRTVRSVSAAAHWSFRMSRQMAPVTEETFGCQTCVKNRTWQAEAEISERTVANVVSTRNQVDRRSPDAENESAYLRRIEWIGLRYFDLQEVGAILVGRIWRTCRRTVTIRNENIKIFRPMRKPRVPNANLPVIFPFRSTKLLLTDSIEIRFWFISSNLATSTNSRLIL